MVLPQAKESPTDALVLEQWGGFCLQDCSRPGEIVMIGYAESEIRLCRQHALQLARKLLEDLCALDGDRHG